MKPVFTLDQLKSHFYAKNLSTLPLYKILALLVHEYKTAQANGTEQEQEFDYENTIKTYATKWMCNNFNTEIKYPTINLNNSNSNKLIFYDNITVLTHQNGTVETLPITIIVTASLAIDFNVSIRFGGDATIKKRLLYSFPLLHEALTDSIEICLRYPVLSA